MKSVPPWGQRVGKKRRNPTHGKDSSENRINLTKMVLRCFIFIRGGESRFMTYCVKTAEGCPRLAGGGSRWLLEMSNDELF